MIRQSVVDIYREAALMRTYFPSFRYRLERGVLIWCGTLQPTGASPHYHVRITYAPGNPPKVWVTSPSLRQDVPHRYSDKSLCLYFPDDKSWTSSSGIAKTIVPWTAEWLLFYENWLVTKEWLGTSAPHSPSIPSSQQRDANEKTLSLPSSRAGC